MAIYRIGTKQPEVAPNAYVAPEATLMGEVSIGSRCSVWPGAVVRGDNEPVRIHDESNVQEGAILHADPGFPLTIEARVTIGHQAMLHGCTIREGSLIGIQAVVMNGAVIDRNCLVGAGALVPEGKVYPERSLILGVPAKVVRTLTDEEVNRLLESAKLYAAKADTFPQLVQMIGRVPFR